MTEAGAPVSPSPEWILGLTESDKEAIGSRLALLILTMPRWIVRRVDQIELHDDTNARRRVSIDFTIPANVTPVGASGKGLTLVPLTYLAKDRLRNFDLRDEIGAALPLLTRRENSEAAAAALAYLARVTLNRPLEEEVLSDLEALAAERNAPPQEMVTRLFRQEGQARPTRFELSKDAAFSVMVERLAETFLLIVPLWEVSGRRVLKFAFDEPFQQERTFGQRFVESLSWSPTRTIVEVAGQRTSGSYHLEAQAPPELTLCSGSLVSAADQVLDRDGGPRPRIHLMTQTRPTRAWAVLRLMAPRGGIIRISFFTALLTAAVLTAGAFRLSALVASKDGVATVLVSVPALIAVYIARPGEHALTSRLLFGVRACVLLSGIASFGASAFLLAGPGGVALEAVWWTFDGVALLMAAMLLVSLTRSRHERKMP